MRHEFKKIEPKWQKKWADQEIFKAVDGSKSSFSFYNIYQGELVNNSAPVGIKCISDWVTFKGITAFWINRLKSYAANRHSPDVLIIVCR